MDNIGIICASMRPEYVEDNIHLDIMINPLDAPELIPAGSIREYSFPDINWRFSGISYMWR